MIPTLVHLHMGQRSIYALTHVDHTPTLKDPPH